MSFIEEVATKIKDRAEAELLSSRYLEGLGTARGLAPKSVKVLAAVKITVENNFDDHEVTFLRARALVKRDFFNEEVRPFFTLLESKPLGSFPVSFIRDMRRKVDESRERQMEAMYTYMQRAEKGLTQMQGSYNIYTNHLPRYAAACALEVLLRAYHALLGLFDPEDPMMSSYWGNL
jgi:hypothetical protein